MGASVTDQGYTLTLDGIGVDEAFITLYATITGEEPIPRNDRGEPELWSFSLKAEGKELEFWDQDRETEWVDDYTLKVMQRCPVARALPDVVELQVYTNELFYGLSGDWSLNLLVDKTAPDGESLVAEPRQSFTMLGHRVRADKVVVAPSGGGLVLREAAFPPLTDFLLRDDTGNYLYAERYGTAGGWLPISNFVAFYGGRLDMESITLVPYERVYPGDEPGGNHKIFGAVDELPLTDDSAETGYTLISLDIGAEQAVARFQTGEELLQYEYGGDGTWFTLLDADGESVEADSWQVSRERDYDWETGVWTVTTHYPGATPEELARVARVSFWQPNDTIRVLEDEAVTIPLN